MNNISKDYSALDLYDVIVRGLLADIYAARKKTAVSDLMKYSNLLIEKFAIHSMSLFHLSKGIVEHKKSGEQKKIHAYDLFTINTTFRALLETYVTFHNLFMEPKTKEETRFRFLLWKLDGQYQKQKFDIGNSDSKNKEDNLKTNERLIEQTKIKIEQSNFISSINPIQLKKIYDPNNRKVSWRFIIINEVVKPKKIIDLINHVRGQ